MIAHPETVWQSRRNRFNHDWLKNKFLLSLGKLINILDDRIEDDAFLEFFIRTGLSVWEQEFVEAGSLIDSFSKNMSPRVLFDRGPMSRWPREKNWFPTMVDTLWRKRCGVDELVVMVQASAISANDSYLILKSKLDAEEIAMSIEVFKGLRPQIVQFRDDCRALAKAIEKFPHRILVT
jgi:hypothetical protein